MKKYEGELGTIIGEALDKKGISQRELARQANMDSAEVNRILSGKRKKPDTLYLLGIANTLGLSMKKLMQLAGYNEIEIDLLGDITSTRSITDYQNQIKVYDKFYFDILQEIENRRSNAFSVKGIIADIVDRIELAKIENKEISNDEILEDLKKAITLIRPNLEKVDKSIYPNVDTALIPREKIKSNVKYATLTGDLIKDEEK